jgi:ribosomal protein L7Ae-like RNA K-turn-binding protein
MSGAIPKSSPQGGTPARGRGDTNQQTWRRGGLEGRGGDRTDSGQSRGNGRGREGTHNYARDFPPYEASDGMQSKFEASRVALASSVAMAPAALEGFAADKQQHYAHHAPSNNTLETKTTTSKAISQKPSKKRKPTLKTLSFGDLLPSGSLQPKAQSKTSTIGHANRPPVSTKQPNSKSHVIPRVVLKRGEALVARVKQQQPQQPTEQQQLQPTEQQQQPTDQNQQRLVIPQPQLQPRDETGDEHVLLRLLKEGKFVIKDKGRQRIRPRKKKFTSLKKKVLQERLDQWNNNNNNNNNNNIRAQQTLLTSSTTTTTSSVMMQSRTVCLFGYATFDEVCDDDEEYEQILSNLREMAERVGPVQRLFLPRQHVDWTRVHPSFVEYVNVKDAAAAIACWEGLVVGGHALTASSVLIESDETNASEEDWQQNCLLGPSMLNKIPVDEQKSSEILLEKIVEINLDNVLTENDLEDEECLDESLKDIRTLAKSNGALIGLRVENRSVILSYKCNEQQVQSLVEALGRNVIGGTQVSAMLLASDQEVYDIMLDNVLTQDDFDDDDCLQESIADVKKLAATYGEITNIRADGNSLILSYRSDGKDPQEISTALGKTVIGGSTVSARVIRSTSQTSNDAPLKNYFVVLKNVLTDADLEDEECLEESLNDVKELAQQFGVVLSVTLNEPDGTAVKLVYESSLDVAKAEEGFNGMIIGGLAVSAKAGEGSKLSADCTTNKTDNVGEAVMACAPEVMFSGDKRIPERFAECKRAPKVPNVGGPRKYASLVEDDTVKPLLAEMLGELMRLQKRAIDDKNAKARRRLVMGLREVARGIRAHKVTMVLMANNLDQYGVIDEKVQEIINLCEQEEVPIFYEFSKKTLGKAIGKTIKVAIVGVQNAEGQQQLYKKLIKLARN